MKGRPGIVAGYNAQAMVSPMQTAGGETGMLAGQSHLDCNDLILPIKAGIRRPNLTITVT